MCCCKYKTVTSLLPLLNSCWQKMETFSWQPTFCPFRQMGGFVCVKMSLKMVNDPGSEIVLYSAGSTVRRRREVSTGHYHRVPGDRGCIDPLIALFTYVRLCGTAEYHENVFHFLSFREATQGEVSHGRTIHFLANLFKCSSLSMLWHNNVYNTIVQLTI